MPDNTAALHKVKAFVRGCNFAGAKKPLRGERLLKIQAENSALAELGRATGGFETVLDRLMALKSLAFVVIRN